MRTTEAPLGALRTSTAPAHHPRQRRPPRHVAALAAPLSRPQTEAHSDDVGCVASDRAGATFATGSADSSVKASAQLRHVPLPLCAQPSRLAMPSVSSIRSPRTPFLRLSTRKHGARGLDPVPSGTAALRPCRPTLLIPSRSPGVELVQRHGARRGPRAHGPRHGSSVQR
jgi:hypothetical protein